MLFRLSVAPARPHGVGACAQVDCCTQRVSLSAAFQTSCKNSKALERATISSELLHGYARAPLRPKHTIGWSKCGIGRGIGAARAERASHVPMRRLRCHGPASRPLSDSGMLILHVRGAARAGSVEHPVRRRRDINRYALEMVVRRSNTTPGHTKTPCIHRV